MRYLKFFNQHSEYETYINNSDKILPNISYCDDNKDIHYNPIPNYAEEYLTFVTLENGTISFTYSQQTAAPNEYDNYYDGNYIEYSLDNGQTWVRTNNSDEEVIVTLNVSTGDKILWKGDNRTLGMEEEWLESSHFSTTCRCDVMGNVMSILYGDNFKNYDTFVENTRYNLMGLFSDVESYSQSCYIVNAENLILPVTTLTACCYCGMFYGCTSLITAPKLPATTLADDCYSNMFSDCTSLITAPELPATTLVHHCYQSMFYNCSSLNYIKAMFTTTPSESYTGSWVEGVAESGTFVKNSAAEWDVTDVNGVPSGWTVQTASA